MSSPASILLAQIASFFEIPVLGVTATSDELSDKTLFPYYHRILPPDRYEIKTTVQIIKSLGWNYFSVLYSEQQYGFNAHRWLFKYAEEAGISVDQEIPVNAGLNGYFQILSSFDLIVFYSYSHIRS